MRFLQVIILSVIHGFTELLPISGSAHWKIAQMLLDVPSGSSFLLLRGMVHLGTAAAVLCAFYKELLRMLGSALTPDRGRGRSRRRKSPGRQMSRGIICGVLPAVLAIPLRSRADGWGNSLIFLGAMLLLNGFGLFFSRRYAYGEIKEPSAGDALLVGLAQTVAVLPGISRIGITTCVGMWRGWKEEFAVMFACLTSAVVSVGIAIADFAAALRAGGIVGTDVLLCLLGAAVAGTAGYAAIQTLRIAAQRHAISKFAYYSWGAGLSVLALALFFV